VSLTQVQPCRQRLNRSQMAVPGSSRKFIDKARSIPADVIMFDLEDAVAPDEKEQARRNVIEAVNDLDWGARTLSVRVNGLDTPWMYRDVIEVAEQAGHRLDLIMLPKTGTAADVYALDVLLTQVELATRRERRTGIEVLIESALGMRNADAIAQASPRLESLHFGPGDYAASIGARTLGIGAPHPGYAVLADADASGARQAHWNDMSHFPIASLVVAARAAGLRPIDGPFADFKDAEGFSSAAMRSAVLGCDGKWVIHPSQVDAANAIFTPSEEEVARARRILASMRDAGRAGAGAVTLDGRMIDVASIRQAETLVRKADAIEAAATGARPLPQSR
jgi:malyl-CoA/(S)-citramalyl-CoA lyase